MSKNYINDLTPQDNIIKAETIITLTELITSLGEPDSEIFSGIITTMKKSKQFQKETMNISLSDQNKTVSR